MFYYVLTLSIGGSKYGLPKSVAERQYETASMDHRSIDDSSMGSIYSYPYFNQLLNNGLGLRSINLTMDYLTRPSTLTEPCLLRV